ncbi:hypothetical protein HPB47_013484 [Ixodes persulcatus]|uniref:Uncharacterized protein n=1 Tax=Ixodes persulcatus TaxID=34615 RepID=A0AC60QZD3_IXOPE|nr:hypothetical protein HPB47_013484 [Ixodes persulcatus]
MVSLSWVDMIVDEELLIVPVRASFSGIVYPSFTSVAELACPWSPSRAAGRFDAMVDIFANILASSEEAPCALRSDPSLVVGYLGMWSSALVQASPQATVRPGPRAGLVLHGYIHEGPGPGLMAPAQGKVEDAEEEKKAEFFCRMCHKSFGRRYHLERHLINTPCSGKPPGRFPCDTCDKVFPTEAKLQSHTRNHADDQEGVKRFACSQCGRRFWNRSLLRIHSRHHSGERPFLCPECPKGFVSLGSLNKHRLCHAKERPHSCPHCPARFTLKGTLNRHLPIHTGVRPHKCPHCSKEFVQAVALKSHLFSHTGQDGFRCTVCGRLFGRKTRMEEHVRTVHEKQRPPTYNKCGKTFPCKNEVIHHRELGHNKVEHFICEQGDRKNTRIIEAETELENPDAGGILEPDVLGSWTLSSDNLRDLTAIQLRRKLRRYARHLSRLCPDILPAKEVFGFLSIIMDMRTDFFAPCSKSENQPCLILKQLVFWNLLLEGARVELLEVAPETIGLGQALRPSSPDAVHPSFQWAFLHWLLKEHSCIKQLRLSCRFIGPQFPDTSPLRRPSPQLWSDNPGAWGSAVLLEAALKELSVLASLRLSHLSVPPGEGVDHLGAALGGMSVLTSLSLSCTSIDPADAKLLLRGLSLSITMLSIDDHLLKPGGGTVLAEYVAQNRVLRKLILRQQVCFEMTELENFLAGLLLNRGLEELHLSGFGLQTSAMELLVEAAVEHEALRILDIQFFDECWQMDGTPLAALVSRNTGLRELVFRGGEVTCCDAFAKAVRENGTLQKLTLNLVEPDDMISVAVYRELLEALSYNDSLQEVNFGIMYSCMLSDFAQLLRETKTETRVKLKVHEVGPLRFAEVMRNCTGFSEMRCSGRWSRHTLSPRELRHLVHYYRLENLSLDLDDQLLEVGDVTCLAHFLSSSRTLQSASLCFLTSAASTRVLLQAISRNRSISNLSLHGWEFGPSEANLLYLLLRNSKILNRLFLQPRDPEQCLVLSNLHVELTFNHSLLSVHVHLGHNVEEMYDVIKHTTHRNTSLMYCAVQFALGSCSRRFAEAFELVWRSPAVAKEVQKLASESELVAKERVRARKRYLDENFLTVAGVVKDAIVCVENGRLQLDRIGLDNWLQIRGYLRVADIKEPMAAAAHRRKRRLHSR